MSWYISTSCPLYQQWVREQEKLAKEKADRKKLQKVIREYEMPGQAFGRNEKYLIKKQIAFLISSNPLWDTQTKIALITGDFDELISPSESSLSDLPPSISL